MAERDEIIITGPNLKSCRRKAAEELGADAEDLEASILQYGKQGWLSDQPYRVRYTRRSRDKGQPSRGASDKIDLYLNLVKADLENLDRLDRTEGEEGEAIFQELLNSYEDLDEDLQTELRQLAGLMSGEGGDQARHVIEAVSRDGTLTVEVSEDGMEARLALTPPQGEGQAVTLGDVMEELGNRGIRQGVDPVRIRRAVDECAENAQPVRDVLVAQGTPPEAGRDGALRICFSQQSKEVLVDDKDRADYRGKARFAQVQEGDELARIVPPTAGTPGVDVYGQEVAPEPGKPVGAEAGQNTYWNEDETAIHSAINGVADCVKGRVFVRPLVIIDGDVDMKSGNVEFDGEVEIRGSVRDHFFVRARSDIRIHGRVEGAEIVSREGSVEISKGVAGRGRCYISARADVSARYVEAATIYAGGTVEVRRAILNSKVVAGGSVLAETGKGMIAGGTVHAAEAVAAKYVGNVNEPPTRIVLGISFEDFRRIEAIDRRIASLQHTLGKIDMILEQVTNFSRDLSSLPAKQRREFLLLKKQTVVSRAKLKKLAAEKKRLEAESCSRGQGELKVYNTLYGHVDVEMAGVVYHNEQETDRVLLTYDDEKGEICARGNV